MLGRPQATGESFEKGDRDIDVNVDLDVDLDVDVDVDVNVDLGVDVDVDMDMAVFFVNWGSLKRGLGFLLG